MKYSWLDEDGDYVYDSGESRGAQPILAYSSWDKIVIVPDGNVFDNSDADGDGIVAFNPCSPVSPLNSLFSSHK